ncbi:MAG: hypothetical protein F6K35_26585, partial [Okeania sp. SIO2H7]|nr:hypothetical protein [Okeania sp. SIO2H7]
MDGKLLYQVLAPESSFEELTILAARIAKVPVAFISFMNGENQWLKSKVGFSKNKHLYLDFVETIISNSEDTLNSKKHLEGEPRERKLVI